MEWWEVKRALSGIRRHDRNSWVTTRWLGWMVSRIMGSKIESPDEMMEFPWEREPSDKQEDERAAAELLEACRQYNAGLSNP